MDPGLLHPARPRSPITIARAPGRLDVMGGISDYSGGLVLQWPIREAATVALRLFEAETPHGDMVRVVSMDPRGRAQVRQCTIPRQELIEVAKSGYGAARAYFSQRQSDHWAAYLAGAIVVLARERSLRLSHALDILLCSEVPEGKGVSSSAAIEVATMRALAHAHQVELEPIALAKLCQKVENEVVGAPCGIMDQMTSALGEADQLLALLCQPAEVQGYVRHAPEIAFWGIDSGIRHAVSGSDYGSVRTGAFMGYRMLAEAQGMPARDRGDGVWECDDRRWKGYLANIELGEFERVLVETLPESCLGSEFLSRYGGITDPVTRVDPGRCYAVREPTAHPVREHARVRRFGELIAGGATDDATLQELGALMYGSHDGYTACGLGSAGTDRLVELVREAGPGQGLFGAKITGGGSGGTVAILGRSGERVEAAVQGIADRYAAETGRETHVFRGSSPGACRVDVIEWKS
jgi:L-arabinokinase